MITETIIFSVAFAALLFASISDLRTREVPDWLNYALIGFGFAANGMFSLIYNTPSFILASLLGFSVFFVIACIMFYTGQWGGGDSKILMGLGAMIGLTLAFGAFLVTFLINSLLVGAAYGLLWSIFLGIKNRVKFMQQMKKTLSDPKLTRARRIFMLIIIAILVAAIFISEPGLKITVISGCLLLTVVMYLWMGVKAIEKSCMFKYVTPDKLTEGDWIANDVKYKGKYITGPKELGINKKQIAKVVSLYKQKKILKVLIKEGIPFVPTFLIAFIITYLFDNILLLYL